MGFKEVLNFNAYNQAISDNGVKIKIMQCVHNYQQIDALEEVVEAVKGRVEVYLDGGIRQGTDVFKALALGARAVFIGRPVLWGLAYQVCYLAHYTDIQLL